MIPGQRCGRGLANSGDVCNHHSGGSFTGVPIKIDQGAVARGEVVVAIQDGAEDDEDA